MNDTLSESRDTRGALAYRIGAGLYVLWGLLHVVAAYRIYEQGAAMEPGLVQARLVQAGWNMLILAVFAIVIAARFNWRNSLVGYWLNLLTISAVDIGFIVIMMIPGHSTDIIGPIVWLLGAAFSTVGIRTAPTTG